MIYSCLVQFAGALNTGLNLRKIGLKVVEIIAPNKNVV